MLNIIWAIMILLGISVGIITGRMEEIGNGALESAGSAVTVCITMLGILSMWTGIMQVAKASGLLSKMAEWLTPVIRFLYPGLPGDSVAAEYIATNMVANIMGLGWAATPAGVKAMEELEAIEEKRGSKGYRRGDNAEHRVTSREMCTLLVINMSSLQLIPINMIAYRSQYGSVAPAVIVAPVLFATLCSTVVAVAYCKVMSTRDSYLKQKF
ncbi:MAG: nucleoside recognition protein [Lachnospiraceae bacterium]|nr:nucleoside recognition protein [Lachnospiraceae bacterium]